jgi:hypothetical protein
MKVVAILALAVLVVPTRAQIDGCTSDVRTGVCNKVCSTKHVAGCTLEQLDPLLKIQSMNCLTAVANKEFDRMDKGLLDDGSSKRGNAACTAAVDKEIQEWKNAHRKKS